MGMPLGPSVQAPAFRPLASTQSAVPQAPAYSPGPDSLRRPGTTAGLDALRARVSDQPYEPPMWARQIQVVDPLFAGGSSAPGTASGFQRPGFPERVNVNPFADDPLGQFLGGDAGVALGMTPGQQRGGAYHGIATTPMTLANFSTWGREGVLALLTSAVGMDLQQPEGATFGPDAQPKVQGDGLIEGVVRGLQGVGNTVFDALDAPMQWFRNSNSFNRGKSVRSLFSQGNANPFLVEAITSSIFGGSERFTMAGIQAAAARQGIDPIDAMAKMYDLDPRVVAAIASNPFMSDAELGQYTDGQPLSTDMLSNLALEGGMQLATLAVGGVGIAKGAALLGRAGLEGAGAFGMGLRGVALGEDAARAAQVARTAGMLSRRALQLNAWNTTAGWSIRGAEWGIKQLAVIGGNDELVKAMDRLMWQMPLSMNPGWNLIDGFSSHPIDAIKNLREGQVSIGRPSSPGYVGQLDLKGMALRDGVTGETMTMRLAGREVRLGRDASEFKVLGRLRDLTPDDMHAQFFSRLGWSRAQLERAFGEGNAYDLTWDDARNALFHVALNAVREGKGAVGRLEGIELPTMAMRTASFVRDNAKGAFKVLDDNLKGTSESMLDLFRGDFWDLAARNDTRMGAMKQHLGAWDPDMAFLDFLSWMRASKVVRNAMEQGLVAKGATPVFRRTVNRDFVDRWRAHIADTYGPDEVVPLSVINQLKRFGGAVETRGKGGMLVRGRQQAYTRRQLEDILDDVLAVDDEFQRRANLVPREQAAAFNKDIDPNIDPLEDARVAGISPTQLELIDKARAKAPEELTAPPPVRLVQKVAAELGRTADNILSQGPAGAWGDIFDWYDAKIAAATETAAIRDGLDNFAKSVREQVGDGRMDAGTAAPIVAGLARIRDELLAPLDRKLSTTRPGLYIHWQETATEAGLLAREATRHLEDPAARWRTVKSADGTARLLPSTVPADLITRYQALVDRVLRSGATAALPEFDRQRLADPLVHPFLKGDSIRSIASPDDLRELAALEQALGGDPRELLVRMAGDAGLDPTDLPAAVDQMTQRAGAYVTEGADLGSRAAQLARRFQTLGGAYSDELADTTDRVLAADAILRKAPGKRKAVTAQPMDPIGNERRAAIEQRASAQRALSDAEGRLSRAQAAVDGAGATPEAFDEATMAWQPSRVFRRGNAAKKRDDALAEAARLRREGSITRVVRQDDASYAVEVAGPKAPEAPPAPPVPATLAAIDQPAGVQADIDLLLATPIGHAELGQRVMDLQMRLAPGRLADPAYAPGEIEGVRAMLQRNADRIRADMEANPSADPTRDPRTNVLQFLDDRLGAIERRQPVDVAPMMDEAAGTPGNATVPATAAEVPGPGPAPAGASAGAVGPPEQFVDLQPGARLVQRDSGQTWVVEAQTERGAWTLRNEATGARGSFADMETKLATPGSAWSWPETERTQGGRVDLDAMRAAEERNAARGVSDLSPLTREGGFWPDSAGMVQGVSGPVRLVVDSETEAASLRAFLAGDDGAMVPPVHINGEQAYIGGAPIEYGRDMRRALEGREWDVVVDEGPQPLRQDGTFPDPGTQAPIAYELRVVSASGLVTSADEGFDPALQPRMRGVRTASDEQIQSIASAPDPARLLGVETGAQGTPVILPDGQVLAGNGRVTGLRGAYTDGTAAEYAAAVGAAEGIPDPVLVRVIDVPREDAIRLAVQLNFETGMPLADQALGLSRLLSTDDIQKLRITASQGIEDALDSGANDAFVNAFMAHIPEQFRGPLRAPDGSLNEQGKELMAATLMARFTNASESLAGQSLIATLFEGDPEVRSLASGMDAIGALIQAQVESIDRPWGGVAPAFASDLVPALQRVFALARDLPNLRDVQAALETIGMGLDEVPLTPTQQALARNLSLMAQQGGGQAAGLRRLLRNVARRIRGHEEAGIEAQPMDLFGGTDALPDPSYPGVVNEAFTAMNLTRPEGKQFALLPDADGVTHVRTLGGEETARLHPVVDDPAPHIEELTPDLGDVVLEGDDWAAHATHAQRTTGRVVLRVDTQAEADALGAYLAGTGEPLPRRYRVVDGEIQPLGDIRGEIVERIYGRYRNEANARAGAGYLTWLLTQEGPRPPVPANVAKFVDSELAFRQGPRAVPTSEGLPALREALAGRDFEVQVGRPRVDDPATVAEAATRREPTHANVHAPDGAALPSPEQVAADWLAARASNTTPDAPYGIFATGERGPLAGPAERYAGLSPDADPWEVDRITAEIDDLRAQGDPDLEDEIASLEESLAAMYAGEEAVAAPAVQPTEIVSRTRSDIDPDYATTTGLSPEVPEVDLDARAAAAAGVHRLVASSDEASERAAQRAAGAPVVRGWHVIEIGAPDAAERLATASAALESAKRDVATARARLDALPPEAVDAPATDVLSATERDLYQRYTASSTSFPDASRQPATVGEVLDLLQSLDVGLPPLVGTMTEGELETLRSALMRVMHARLDELGAGPTTGPARRAGAGSKRARQIAEGGTGVRVTDEPMMTSPEDFTADLAEVMRTLQGRVYEAADQLDGWEGTQYEIGMMPTKGKDGGPLAPRIPAGEDWIGRLDELVPGLGEELLHGRKRAWAAREEDARWAGWLRHTPAGWMMGRIRSLADTAVGARPERAIVRDSIDRFTAEVLKHFTGDAEEYADAVSKVNAMIGAVHEGMADTTMTFAKLPKYRRMGIVPPDRFDQWALKAFEKDGGPPEWLKRFVTEQQAAGIKHPIAEAWRQADNRIRAYFSQQPGGMAMRLNQLYDSRVARTAHDIARNTTVGYHIARFLMDLRWLGLEAIEAPTLTLFQEGPGAVLEAMGKGANAGRLPLFMGKDAAESMRTQYAWWLAQSDPGALLRTRERYLFAIVRRKQEQEFPRALMEAARRSPDIMGAIKAFDGGEPMAWLKQLDADWELAASRGRPIDTATAERLFKPWLEKGVISAKEYDEFVKAGRYTGHPALDAALSRVADPRLTPLLERLAAINEQGWHDAARLVFGSTDRSNLQRLANHPLLWWPVSYQIKAAKWLGGLLFDRAFGIDTGAAGAVTLGMLHEQHKKRLAEDPEYARTLTENPTLLFFAQMLFPIAPWDMGVALSPFTRLAIAAATNDSPAEGYRRNIFSVGPGYTYYSMLPRLFYEQSKPGAQLQQMGFLGDLAEAGQRFAPYSIPLAPTTSELGTVERQAGAGGIQQPEPFQPPAQPRY